MKKVVITTIISGITAIAFTGSSCYAQNAKTLHMRPVHKVYLSSGTDGNLLSSSLFSESGGNQKMTVPRFTAFFNFGLNLNYDFSAHAGAYTGLHIKNIGFIEKTNGQTIKRRDYTFGFPLGLKFGNLNNGNYLLIGGGIDFPFNYREKTFTKRNQKQKFNEWFSNRVPVAMGYVFLGVHLQPGIALKLEYYPGNFLNPDFTENIQGLQTPVRPYVGYKVHLMVLAFGFDFPYKPKEFKDDFQQRTNIENI